MDKRIIEDKLETWHEDFNDNHNYRCPYTDCHLKNKFVQCGNHSHVLCYVYKTEYSSIDPRP